MRTRQLLMVPLAATMTLAIGCSGTSAAGPKDDRATNTSGGDSPTSTPKRDDRAMFEAIQTKTAECMRAKGWEYRPMEYVAPPEATGGSLPTTMDPANGRKHGYGIVDGYMSMRDVADQAGGGGGGAIVVSGSLGGAEAPKDPNADYLASLSQSEQKQYMTDLAGEGAFVEMSTDDVESEDGALASGASAPSIGGCSKEAIEAVDPGASTRMQQQADLFNGITDDPDLAEATETWSACMAKAGYEYDKPDDAVMGAVNDIAREAGIDGPTNPSEPMPVFPAELEEPMRKLEIQQWNADYECQKASGYEKTFRRLVDGIMKDAGGGR